MLMFSCKNIWINFWLKILPFIWLNKYNNFILNCKKLVVPLCKTNFDKKTNNLQIWRIKFCMNIAWVVIMLAGILIMIFKCPNLILSTMLSASQSSVKLCISLLAIYAVWLGLLKILENTGFNKVLAKWLSPIITFLFGKNIDDYTKSQIAINLSSNILGLGNASTPSAIKAMQGLDNKTGKINNAMIMLMVINCLSFQLLPTTIMGLMASSGSKNVSRIIAPTICTSLATGIIIIFVLKLIFKMQKNKNAKSKV